MADYCDNADVAIDIQHITLGASTDPSTTEVDIWCGQVTAIINGRLGAVGITVPIVDTEKLKIIKALSVDWVVWKVLSSIDLESEEAALRRASFERAIKRIEEAPAVIEETSTVESFPEGSIAGTRPFRRDARDW